MRVKRGNISLEAGNINLRKLNPDTINSDRLDLRGVNLVGVNPNKLNLID